MLDSASSRVAGKRPHIPDALPASLAAAPPRLFGGTSGWAYSSWRPGFYPATVTPRNFLGFYSSQLNCVEVNYTFRKLPTQAQLEGWMAQVPEGFRFSFKAPQRITHFSRLRDCGEHVGAFLDALKPAQKAGKMGLVLFQLPPNSKANPDLLQEFLRLPRLRSRTAPKVAFEFRHPSWFAPEIEEVLRRFGAAYCVAETDDLTTPEIHTAKSFTCFRLRKSGGYTAEESEHVRGAAPAPHSRARRLRALQA